MGAEQQYIDIFTQHESLICEHAAAVVNAPRKQALEDFKALGFPSTKGEDYKYTDIQKAFAPDYGMNLGQLPTPAVQGDIFRCHLPENNSPLYLVVNDSFYKSEKSEGQLPDGVFAGSLTSFAKSHPQVAERYYAKAAPTSEDAIVAINTMFAQDGFVLYVPEGVVVEQPLQLINILYGRVDMMANRRVLIIMEPRSQAKLLACDRAIYKTKFLSTQVVEIFAEEGSFFDYYDLEENSENTTRFSSLHIQQAASSNVLVNGITLVNGLTRNNYYISLNGEHAETTLCGMAILDKEKQVDTYSLIRHSVPNCQSTELFKNVLNDKSVGSFAARILVEKDAQKTTAYQTNRNLCISREARMYSKPQLEIYADDVKCSHGMTTGQLDETALFYLRSRGIPEAEARMLLSVAFTTDVLEKVRFTELKERLTYLVEKRFRGKFAICNGCASCGSNED